MKPSRKSLVEINRVVNEALKTDVGRNPSDPIIVAVAVVVYQRMPRGPGKMVTYSQARHDLVGARNVRTGKRAGPEEVAAEALKAMRRHLKENEKGGGP